MNPLQCEKCSQVLALADGQCPACGHPVPHEQRLEAFQGRADGLAEAERYADAARALEPALALQLDPADAKLLWRKKGVWLRKASVDQPQYLDGAEAALAESLRLDDLDDLSHQIWIDLIVQRGFAEKARAWYKHRLELDPEDGMAKRQLAVLKLAADFKTQPRPASILEKSAEPKGLLWRLVVPTPMKTWSMGLSGAFALIMAVRAALSGPVAAAPAAPDPDLASAVAASPTEMLAGLNDPWTWFWNALFSFAYVYWAYTRSKRIKRG